MTTDFKILCAETVPDNYTWDFQAPFDSPYTFRPADFTTSYVSGYAPGVRVYFANTSQLDLDFDFFDFSWDFGDYYHNTNNVVSLTCVNGIVLHTYIMPGRYTVSLIQTQIKEPPALDQTGLFTRCQTKYDIQWSWDTLKDTRCVEWDATKKGAEFEKWWANEEACFGKNCNYWSWYSLAPHDEDESNEKVINPVRWGETATDEIFEKKWMFEGNDTICELAIDKVQQTTIKTAVIEVKEIMPEAGMSCETQPQYGSSPLTVQLSPRHCKPGSFPIDRIDWDFGDGTPIKTITRYAPPSGDDIINNDLFQADSLDVRRYDVLHTYYRNKDEYPMFYPALTCYSASTNSYDSCCLTIGPVKLPDSPTNIHLVKTRNTLKGNIHAFINDTFPSFVTTTPLVTTIIPTQQRIPLTKIRDYRDTLGIFPVGYNGDTYPQEYTPDCTLRLLSLPERFLTTEDSTFDNVTDNLTAVSGVPIMTERDYFIYPT